MGAHRLGEKKTGASLGAEKDALQCVELNLIQENKGKQFWEKQSRQWGGGGGGGRMVRGAATNSVKGTLGRMK